MPERAPSPQTWPEEGPEAECSAVTTSLGRWPKACPWLGLLQISRRGEGSVAWKPPISSSNSRPVSTFSASLSGGREHKREVSWLRDVKGPTSP